MNQNNDEFKFLSWFLGPKAENSEFTEDMLLLILRDYIHWRKNYFPGDNMLITKVIQRGLLNEQDNFNEKVHELLASLRRNFPFYNPRYIAHELSDITLPSLFGYFAGMLYNPNNVTPEAAPVTTYLEIESCNAILSMLGYTQPPNPPQKDKDPSEYYESKSHIAFSWAHITSGGTVANIEAFWIIRQVRYFPIAVKHVAEKYKLDIKIQLPNGHYTDIKKISRKKIINLKPNEAIYLLPKYIDAIRKQEGLGFEQADKVAELAWERLYESPNYLGYGLGHLNKMYKPKIYVAGTAHYSIKKAVDVIGLGHMNIVKIETDSSFRLNVKVLEEKIRNDIKENYFPLAVVVNIGSTEEGAVDPLHEVLDLQKKLEQELNISFWIHVDAAWGGFIRSLFCLESEIIQDIIREKTIKTLELEKTNGWIEWFQNFSSKMEIFLNDANEKNIDPIILNEFIKNIKEKLNRISLIIKQEDKSELVKIILRFPKYFAKIGMSNYFPEIFDINLGDYLTAIGKYVSQEIDLPFVEGGNSKKIIRWPSKDVCSAFMAFPNADSITVDPHKLGYLPYPCGCIAFKNDRVRSFVLQKAPYITASKHTPLIHRPPLYTSSEKDEKGEYKTRIDSFGPFILEGSKPGAAAAGLWLSLKIIPPTMKGHGTILRASLLAARELYEWLTRWNHSVDDTKKDIDFKFIPLTPTPPDTNLVTFVVKKKTSNSLARMNKLTELVYKRFTILSELGNMEYSYSQPFFLSNTTLHEDNYSYNALDDFFKLCQITDSKAEYKSHGLYILRATVMNPYILPFSQNTNHNYIKLFIEELALTAEKHVKEI